MAVGTYILTTVFLFYLIAICRTQPDSNRKCNPGEVRCANTSRCIPRKWMCDGDADCPNKTDELKCGNETCSLQEFMCKSGKCIPASWKCDGDDDCGDHSDEKSCTNKTCLDNEFMCKTSQKCISRQWRCDGDKDCIDNSDELNCNMTRNTCKDGEFTCNSNECIHESWVCDGANDCVDGSDERNCTACRENMFMCQTSKKCISKEWRCDGTNDCVDKSDEVNCNMTRNTCKDVEFTCNSNECIHESWVCDGANDCVDGSDERNCTKEIKCTSSQFPCDKKTCIEEAKKCDGFTDCYNGRDEANCETKDTKVILADTHSLKLVTLLSGPKKALSRRISPSRTGQTIIGVDFDYEENYVFWTDNKRSGIFVASFQNTSGSITDERAVLSDGIITADGMAVDWVNNLIYWTDTGRDEISVTNYNGTMKKVLFRDNLDEPRGIIVDPLTGWMYWTDWGNPAKIERSGMNGQQRETIVASDLTWPNGITLDYDDGRLYWVDSKLRKVESSQVDGSDRRVISSGKISHDFAISTSKFDIFITSWADIGITGLSKSNGEITKFTNERTDSISRPMGMKVYSNTMQKRKTSICYTNEFECGYLCLPRPAQPPSTEVQYTCACPDGITCGISSNLSSTTLIPTSTTVETSLATTRQNLTTIESEIETPTVTPTTVTPTTTSPKTTDIIRTKNSTSGFTTTQNPGTSTTVSNASTAPTPGKYFFKTFTNKQSTLLRKE
ncbi:low-density lipoprotein receptor-related protein 8-like isoform X2 [Ylistrum balloti]|uniref:low-density lipoprotein receptor-related protein 8-like isoform X2 n=1 Tax=Ylistrum balloti TaxID=509963 RepID=UPI00290598A5|nr:low-density lipoprotein receptor-related protein 8-like isoform X2 [Ylistrum balloti]